jgi:hypothetical protein
MKSGRIGAVVGLTLGLIVGTALFGPIGGVVGLLLGSVLGFVIVTPLAVSYVKEMSKTPFAVQCPETHMDVKVTLDPKKAARAELWNRRQEIQTCTRVNGKPHCDEKCLEQIGL